MSTLYELLKSLNDNERLVFSHPDAKTIQIEARLFPRPQSNRIPGDFVPYSVIQHLSIEQIEAYRGRDIILEQSFRLIQEVRKVVERETRIQSGQWVAPQDRSHRTPIESTKTIEDNSDND